MYRLTLTLALLVLLVPAALAQSSTTDTDAPTRPAAQQDDRDRIWQFWVRGSGQLYENFFQSPSDGENVTALTGEVGASLGLTRGLRAYGSVNYLHFLDDEIEGSPGIRVGLRGDRRPHGFDVYAEQLSNRPSFDLDEFQGAEIRRLAGEYTYRFLPDWQASVDGELEGQEFDGTPQRDNRFGSLGAAVRWRGSRVFSPELGVRFGNRDVEDELQTYGQRETYIQVRSQTTERLYLSVRLRDRRRDYANIPRDDTRRQIAVSADYTLVPNIVLNLYGARERVDTTLPNRDFTAGLWIVGLTYRF